MRVAFLLLFAALFAYALTAWQLSPAVVLAYAVASIVCFIVYAYDKAAAKAHRWRTSENTLLLLALACGWPGGMLAQQLLRHKTNKASFATQFWLVVLFNVGVFALLTSPYVELPF
ncbi:MAG: DUF1294 domain-containing protein [Pseudomonadota bacterium]